MTSTKEHYVLESKEDVPKGASQTSDMFAYGDDMRPNCFKISKPIWQLAGATKVKVGHKY
jgi:hypothetical protein